MSGSLYIKTGQTVCVNRRWYYVARDDFGAVWLCDYQLEKLPYPGHGRLRFRTQFVPVFGPVYRRTKTDNPTNVVFLNAALSVFPKQVTAVPVSERAGAAA
ncbi:hypothetical protein [Litorimonas haliclonae]|uniref:hypothetical protein n=1 Tax=Litorimonas haliclonae TaxID=2081977 RepID=UPI0039EE3D7D